MYILFQRKINLKDYTWDGQSIKINIRKHQKKVMEGVVCMIKNMRICVTILNVSIINTREYLFIYRYNHRVPYDNN